MLKKKDIVLQDGPADCGICSLLMIIKYYGGDVSKEYLRNITNTNKNGVTALSLLETGNALGFSTKGVEGDIINLEQEYYPCIAHVIIDNSYKHFVVISKINCIKKIITIADPAVGIVNMKIEDFNKIATNNYLLFTPLKPIPTIKSDRKVFNIIIDFVIKNKAKFISIILFSLIYTFLNILTSFNIQLIIENVISTSNKYNLHVIIVSILFFVILKVIIDYFRAELLNFINHKLDYNMIENIYKHILSLPHLYYKNRTTGEIISRLQDLGELRESLSKMFVALFVDLLLVIFVLITLFLISNKLTIIAIIVAAIHLLCTWIFNRYLSKIIKKIKESNAKANSYMIESIKSNDTIKGLNLLERVSNRFLLKYCDFLSNSYHFNKVYNKGEFLKDFLSGVGEIIVLLVGVYLVLDNIITLAELITFNSLLIYFMTPIKNLFEFDLVRRKAYIALERLEELYDIKKEEFAINEMYTGKRIKGFIKIKELKYSYNNKENLLNNINLSIDKGEKVVIYGQSGSGKSTIAKIIMKYLNIDRSMVFIDGKDVNDYHLMDIRENISYISQNEMLFNDTIYNNISLSEKESTYDDFLKVCNICKVEEIYSNDIRGANMIIDEDSSNISGGEKERIVLARALLKNSSIYILDESLSQIDVKSEKEILENIFTVYKNKTFIVISHRYDNESLFDKVIKIDEEKCHV